MSVKSLSILLCVIFGCVTVLASPWVNHGREDVIRPGLVRKDERISLVSTEFGEISAVHLRAGAWGTGCYLQFITLEPNALFLPALLHADMVFFVDSGTGRLSWADDDGARHVQLKKGDVFRLHPGSIFFVQSNLETERRKLRIYAIFTNAQDDLHESVMGPYSSLKDIILGFDKEVLQAAFQVPKEMIAELTSGTRQPAIVHAPTTKKKDKSLFEIESQFLEVILGRSGRMFDVNKKKSGTKPFNIFDQKPDFKNRYGQSLIVNKKNFHVLKKPNLSIFMVNLTAGSMMGPHWNPKASEVSIVIEGEGMISIVGPIPKNHSDINQNTRFHVGEGDVFVVPRFNPMAQMAFTNDSFVFMGFSSTTKKNHPQYLAGKASVLRTLEKQVVAASFGVTNMSTFDRFLDQQGESVILECASCAEEELKIVKEEMKRRKEEEEERRREEEERKREEKRRREEERKKEEEKKRQREEEEERRREGEEAKRREEEEAEAKKREEEARKRREEEARKEEKEARKQEEERRKREEEAARRREEESEAKKRQEEARKRREEEARREEEEARRQEEERREDEEEMRRKEEEKQKREQEEEEEERAGREEEARRAKEEARREEEEAERQEEERRQHEEEEAREREEEERQKREEEEEEASQKKEEQGRTEEEGERKETAKKKREEEEARRQEEEAVRREKEEEARRREEEQGKAREETQEGAEKAPQTFETLADTS